MLAFLNLSPSEIAIVAVVAIVVFGRRLPEVAGQAAGMMQRMRRSMDQLRRETGIDREIREARRSFERSSFRDLTAEAEVLPGHEAPPPHVAGSASTEEAEGEPSDASTPDASPPGGSEGPEGSGGSGKREGSEEPPGP